MSEQYQEDSEPVSVKVTHFIQDIWPSIYGTVNGILFGIIGFIKDTIRGLWS